MLCIDDITSPYDHTSYNIKGHPDEATFDTRYVCVRIAYYIIYINIHILMLRGLISDVSGLWTVDFIFYST